jgi:hypothetical protein
MALNPLFTVSGQGARGVGLNRTSVGAKQPVTSRAGTGVALVPARQTVVNSLLTPSRVGVAIDLVSGDPQARNTVAVNVALPGQQFIDRQRVELAHILNGEPTRADGSNHGRLTSCGPPLPDRRQLVCLVENLQPIGVRGHVIRDLRCHPTFPYRRISQIPMPTTPARNTIATIRLRKEANSSGVMPATMGAKDLGLIEI